MGIEATQSRVVGVRTFGDEVLAAIAPLGLALAAGSALVVDLDPQGPPYPGERSLVDMAADGPTRSELTPGRARVAVLRNGGADPGLGVQVVQVLASSWPVVVVRVGHFPVPFPIIPVRPLWPGFMAPVGERPSVWQRVRGGGDPPGPGPALPPPGRRAVMSLLAGRRPPGSRWVRSWAAVWELPWE